MEKGGQTVFDFQNTTWTLHKYWSRIAELKWILWDQGRCYRNVTVFLNVDFLFEIYAIRHLSWDWCNVSFLARESRAVCDGLIAFNRRNMCKDSVFVSTLARKSKCFLSWQQVVIDSNKILRKQSCFDIDYWPNLIYANIRKTRRSGVNDYVHLGQLLFTREAYWMAQLFPLYQHGLQKSY